MDKGRLLTQLLVLVAGQVTLYFTIKLLFRLMDPQRDRKDKALAASTKVLERLGRDVELSEYEQLMATDVVDAADLTASFADVGGLAGTVEQLRESVVLPFTRPDIFKDDALLLRAPSGVLLYGPPGCGKTLLARALAKECGCCFINLQPSSFMDKWYGESQKLVEALFSLARKLQPTLIFIDEIDAFLRERMATDNEATAMVKAQFMSLWDGFASGQQARVVVVGATNRPGDVDRAIVRRMPLALHVDLPDERQREDILRKLLARQKTEQVDLARLAQMTAGFSGSGLRELCRLAAMATVRDHVRAGAEAGELRPVTMRDFEAARGEAARSAIST